MHNYQERHVVLRQRRPDADNSRIAGKRWNTVHKDDGTPPGHNLEVQRNDGRPTIKERHPPDILSDTELSEPIQSYYHDPLRTAEGVTGEIVCL